MRRRRRFSPWTNPPSVYRVGEANADVDEKEEEAPVAGNGHGYQRFGDLDDEQIEMPHVTPQGIDQSISLHITVCSR